MGKETDLVIAPTRTPGGLSGSALIPTGQPRKTEQGDWATCLKHPVRDKPRARKPDPHDCAPQTPGALHTDTDAPLLYIILLP